VTTKDVDAYIAAAPKAAQPLLRQLRELIRSAAPKAEERISYGMPYYRYHGHLVYFSIFKNHIGLYPAGYADQHPEMKKYMTSKGTYRFSLDEPLPVALIRRFVKTRVRENELAGRAQGAIKKAAAMAGSARRSSTARSKR
jgi:uncharacterized protein YdhG (YjbR/CyaY superfamily)